MEAWDQRVDGDGDGDGNGDGDGLYWLVMVLVDAMTKIKCLK
jgi:hypothetical protein